MPNNLEVLVVGAGTIAEEYVKVLLDQGHHPLVVGRGEKNADRLQNEYPETNVFSGGVESWLNEHDSPEYAIVATPIGVLSYATRLLLERGAKRILVEKPLTFDPAEAKELKRLSRERGARVFIAYNRRSYQSVLGAENLIEEDGGVTSFYFNFTEALFAIDPEKYSRDTLRRWGIANSTHVIDTAFYLGGTPDEDEWICRQSGDSVAWHPAGSIFNGSGKTRTGIPFSYHADWGAPGRWNIEIMTPKRKLLFSPMERLREQQAGGFAIEPVDLDYSLDEQYKPGFFEQVRRFTGDGKGNLPEIENYGELLKLYRRIFNYT